MPSFTLAAAALLAPVLATAASAAPAATANLADVRCAAVFASAGADAAPGSEQAQGTTGAFMYYIGRIDARTPGYDIQGALVRVLSAPDYDRQYPADSRRCGAEMAKRGEEISRIGEVLQSRAPGAGATAR